MKKHTLAAGMLAAVILASCTKNIDAPTDENFVSAANVNSQAQEQGASGNHVPNELLVKFKAGTTGAQKAAAFGRMNAEVKEHILTAAMKHAGDNEGVYLLRTSLNALDAVSRARGVEVAYAEPNWVYNHNATSNDTYYTNGSLWGMYGDATSPANQYGSQAGEAWAAGRTGSSSVYIGIIDEGYMYNHEDLAANAGTNPKEASGLSGVDDDGNGLVDDIYGWDFDGNNNTIFDGTGDDHGTHVAGTIGGIGGNGKGVAGVVWNVKLLSAKFLGRNGGTLTNAIKAVDYFTDLKTNQGINLVATNNSWGGGGFSQGLFDAIERANAANILFIAAAGNDGLNTENSPSYPSGYANANIIAVASITSTGALSSFSNYAATKVDIGAPGSGIWSTVPASSKGKIVSSYASYNGTSMATPHVTGGAALYAASNPGASAATIKAAIMSSAVATPSLNGKCVSNGRLNVSGF